MKPPVSLDRARQVIQGWYNAYCKDFGKPRAELQILEVHDQVSNAYKVTNKGNGATIPVYWSTMSDFEASGGAGLPNDFGLWDAFGDLG